MSISQYDNRAAPYPALNAAAITPNDATDLATATRGLYAGTGGDLTVLLVGDTVAVTFTNLAGGVVYPFRVKRVYATGTTCLTIVGLS